jgi:glycine/D-amino acid oxidase-like deaminating enzyme
MTAPNAGGANGPARDGPLDVIVIGAGQAGLAAAWQLAQRRLRFVVVEAAGQLGHSWRTRWDSLRLFSPAQYDALPGMAFPAPADTYPGKEAVADFLRDYAVAFDLPVRLGQPVTALRRVGSQFEVRAGDELLRAQQVVVATGPFQVPFLPPAARGFHASVTQIHSADYRNPQALPPGPVLVGWVGRDAAMPADHLIDRRPPARRSTPSPGRVPELTGAVHSRQAGRPGTCRPFGGAAPMCWPAPASSGIRHRPARPRAPDGRRERDGQEIDSDPKASPASVCPTPPCRIRKVESAQGSPPTEEK